MLKLPSLAICTKIPTTLESWNRKTPIPHRTVPLSILVFKVWFPWTLYFSMYFDHFFLSKFFSFFASSFLGLWLFAGSASIYVFLAVCVCFFLPVFPSLWNTLYFGLVNLLIFVLIMKIGFSIFFFFEKKIWMLDEGFNSLYLVGGFFFSFGPPALLSGKLCVSRWGSFCFSLMVAFVLFYVQTSFLWFLSQNFRFGWDIDYGV